MSFDYEGGAMMNGPPGGMPPQAQGPQGMPPQAQHMMPDGSMMPGPPMQGQRPPQPGPGL